MDRLNTQPIQYNEGDSMFAHSDVRAVEDENGYEMNFLGGILIRTKFLSDSTNSKHTQRWKDKADDDDSSISSMPESFEAKSLESLDERFVRNGFNWNWKIFSDKLKENIGSNEEIVTHSASKSGQMHRSSENNGTNSQIPHGPDQIVIFRKVRDIDRT